MAVKGLTDEQFAKYIYDYLSNDDEFADDGRRNDDAVDFSLACFVLELDPKTEAKKILDKFKEHPMSIDRYGYKIVSNAKEEGIRRFILFEEHLERVEPYLDTWAYDHRGIDYYLTRSYTFTEEELNKYNCL